MPPQIATLVFMIGIAGLFYLDREDSKHASKARWLPVIWLSINGSRSVASWLGMGTAMEIPGQLPESSALDQVVAGTLMFCGVIVLIRYRGDISGLLKTSWPIVLYFSFCLVSLVWSDFPIWGLKRWIRALGDLVMVLIVVTDREPTAALRCLFSRIGFVLLPVSVLLIKYYPYIGRGFGDFGNEIINTGVTTNKNSLGILVLVVALGTLWQIIDLLRDKKRPNRTRRLVAQCTLLAFGIDLLFTAHCATAGASFALGAGFMLVICQRFFRVRPAAVHALVVAMLLAGGLALMLGAKGEVVKAMGRNEDLTGRTEIWAIVIPMVPSSIGGAGFETFWLGPRAERFNRMLGGISAANEAHNGYVEVYLNLGWLGLALIALVLGHGYLKTLSAFRRDWVLGALLVANVVTALAYNVGEAAFRMLSLEWFFLLLSIMAANRVITAPLDIGTKLRKPRASRGNISERRCFLEESDPQEALPPRFL